VAPLIAPPSPTTSKIAPDKQDVKAPQKAPKSKKRLVKKEPKVELKPKSQKGATEKDSNWLKRLLKRGSPGNSGWNEKY
jgi:hypothetical protein